MILPEDDPYKNDIMMATAAPPAAAPAQTAAPTATAAPGGTPAASSVPPWLQQFRAGQDQRRTDFRNGMDAFYGGLGKMFQGDLQGGFGQWQQHHAGMRDRMGQRFQMPSGFAARLPWGQPRPGQASQPGAAPAQGVAPGEPNPANPDTPEQASAKHKMLAGGSAWWAPGAQMRGAGMGHTARPQKPGKPAKPAPKKDDAP